MSHKLPAMTYRDVVACLRRRGFVFDRPAKGSHEIWFNPATRARTTLPRHPGDLPRGTLRAIIKQTGLSVNQFLT
jgi:predicted RNA binding protein YcfA (HicA-like mRNA interferase family)